MGLVAFGVMAMAIADDPDTGAHGPSQSAADVLREFAGTDGAFLAAGTLKAGGTRDNLASFLQYPTDGVVIVSLTGAQVRQALERSVSLYPQPSSFFLQISGFEVTFKRDATASPRVVSVTAGGNRLDESRTYTVAMPTSLGRGGLGYFKIWERDKISRTIENATLESVLKGKRATDSAPRYTAVD